VYIDYQQIRPQARVWVYQASRPLSDVETARIEAFMGQQLQGWQAHQHDLQAAVTITDQRYLVLAVDENYEQPSGCSIDKSVHWLQQIGAEIGVDFFDRSVVYLNDNHQPCTATLTQIKSLVAQKEITADTLIYNNLANTKDAWQSHRLIKASDSWLKRYF
jgi:hypothetical protein